MKKATTPTRASPSLRRPPSARSASSPHAASPPFGRLFLAGLRSVGIEYVALDHLRKAKKNALDMQEYGILWRLLHDLVMVVLLDFDIDVDAVRAASTAPPLDHTQLALWQELARHYLYEWGFVCHSFYSDNIATPASVLLLAVAWLLAHARFFERQHPVILEMYMQTAHVDTAPARLPPYPNDVAIPDSAIRMAVKNVQSSSHQLAERIQSNLDMSARLHQLQALAGRIHVHQRMLQTSRTQYDRMLQRLEQQQRENGSANDDELLPAYVLQVFAHGKHQLELHVRILTERLQMIEDEKLFYKWINGLVLQYAPAEPNMDKDASMVVLESQYASLYSDILHAKSALEQTTPLYQQVASLFASETKQWKEKTKTTRSQQVKMDEKMEKLRREIAMNELLDIDAIFLDRSKQGSAKKMAPEEKRIEQADLERLQHQLERVMREISTEYCRADLI